MRWIKKIFPALLAFVILCSSSSALAISLSSKGGFVLNANTYEEVYSYNGDTPMVPASMTKVMSLYVIYDAMAKGAVTKDTQIPISPQLAAYSRDPGYSNVYLSSGATYSLDELLSAIVVVSANAAVMAVGDYLFGSEANFVSRMNQFVSDWGLNAWFADCTGVSSQNRISPRSMATVANRLIADYPDVLNYSSQTSINFRGTGYSSTNKMLPGRQFDYTGTQGLKTGTTSAAGCCFTGTVERDGVRLISVIMGAPATNIRYTDSIKMLDYSFAKIAETQKNPEIPSPTPEDIANQNAVAISDATRIFINDCEIPAYISRGSVQKDLVMIDDLVNYGFDISYDQKTNTVTVYNNRDKEINAYPSSEIETAAGVDISNTETAAVLLIDGEGDKGTYAAEIFDLNGYLAIDVNELVHMGWVMKNENTKMVIVVTR